MKGDDYEDGFILFIAVIILALTAYGLLWLLTK